MQTTGTARNKLTDTGNIGPLPNLYKAYQKADLTASTTSVLKGVLNTTTRKPNLSWSGATDNVRAAMCRIYRNGVLHAAQSGATYADAYATVGQSYAYTVRAVDAAGQVSPASNVVTIAVK